MRTMRIRGAGNKCIFKTGYSELCGLWIRLDLDTDILSCLVAGAGE